jgi:hypothetical protein
MRHQQGSKGRRELQYQPLRSSPGRTSVQSRVDRRQRVTNAGGPCQTLKSLPLSPLATRAERPPAPHKLVLELGLWLKVSAWRHPLWCLSRPVAGKPIPCSFRIMEQSAGDVVVVAESAFPRECLDAVAYELAQRPARLRRQVSQGHRAIAGVIGESQQWYEAQPRSHRAQPPDVIPHSKASRRATSRSDETRLWRSRNTGSDYFGGCRPDNQSLRCAAVSGLPRFRCWPVSTPSGLVWKWQWPAFVGNDTGPPPFGKNAAVLFRH